MTNVDVAQKAQTQPEPRQKLEFVAPDKVKATSEVRAQYLVTLMLEISRHVGKTQTIGMGDLYTRVTGNPWGHRINDTRLLRTLVTEARKRGMPICSDTSHSGGGYYLASAASDMNSYLHRLRNRALRALALEATIRRIALPDLLGQLALELPYGTPPGGAA